VFDSGYLVLSLWVSLTAYAASKQHANKKYLAEYDIKSLIFGQKLCNISPWRHLNLKIF
jgi:hypothetical protein